MLAASVAGAGAPRPRVEQLLGPERAALDPGVVRGIAAALQGGMSRIFWSICAVAFAAFAASLAFPGLRVPAPAPAVGGSLRASAAAPPRREATGVTPGDAGP